MISLLFTAWLNVVVLMALAWLILLLTQNPGVIDLFWSLAIFTAGLTFVLSLPTQGSAWIMMGLLSVWAIRLSTHLLFTRILKGHIERRYSHLKRPWGLPAWLGYFLQIQLQGVLAMIMASPFLFLTNHSFHQPNGWIGVTLSTVGILGEHLADKQLTRFKHNPSGPVCNIGLWQYCRHPNYFFDWLIWLGFFIASLSSWHSIAAMISPLLLLGIMLYITIPITERYSLTTRKEAYEAYQRNTPAFFPKLWIRHRPHP